MLARNFAAQSLTSSLPEVLKLRRKRTLREVAATREEIAKAGKLTLAKFIRLAWHVVEPSRPYVHGRHIDCVSDHLEAITHGEVLRLLITLPPGMMKSLLCAVFWMAWEWGPQGFPNHRFIGFSYDKELSSRDSLKCRRLIQSQWYQILWGDRFRLMPDQNVKTRWENDRTGFRIADYVGGGTGDRGDRDLVDDPHNVRDGESDAKRGEALLWLSETLPSRLNDPERSAIVVIHHRIHEQDMGGEILAKDIGYEHLMLPMEFEPVRRCYTSVGHEGMRAKRMRYLHEQQIWLPDNWKPEPNNKVHEMYKTEFDAARPRWVFPQDWRTKEDELLFPERFPRDVVERDKKAMSDYAVAGQFQQRPVPRGGGMFQRVWFKTAAEAPADCYWCRYWDLAATEERGAAFTAGVLMGRSRSTKMLYIGSSTRPGVIRGQLDGNKVKTLIMQTAAQDLMALGKPNYMIGIPKDPGQAGKVQATDFTIMLQGYDVKADVESGDKETRAQPFARQVEAGTVALVGAGAWVEPYLAEVEKFPNAKFKDQVDASSGAFGHLLLYQKYRTYTGSVAGGY